MPYTCAYDKCDVKGREIPTGDAVYCEKCSTKKKLKTFHKNCFDEHNLEDHDGKAKAKSAKEIAGTNISSVKIGNKIIK